MKSIKLILGMPLLAVLSFIFIAGCYPNYKATETKTAEFQLTGRPDLRIENNDGDIDIRTAPNLSTLHVVAKLTAWGSTESKARERLQNMELKMEQTGDAITLRYVQNPEIVFGIYRGSYVDFEILMPEDADVSIKTDDGDVTASNLSGFLKIRSDDGDLNLSHVAGDLELSTDDGDITVKDAAASLHASADDGDIWFEGELVGTRHLATTDDGDITFFVPADSSLHIDITVDDGHIFSNLPIQGMRDDQHWSVTLNSADAVLTLIADDGDISIRELRE